MDLISFDSVENRILKINDINVIIDADAADLFGVETKYLNKMVKNNADRFPNGYIINLSSEQKTWLTQNVSRLEKIKYSPHTVKAFTEKGAYMLATILKGPRAVQTSIAIIETFAKLKELERNIIELKNIEVNKGELSKTGRILNELVGDNLNVNASETTIELNFAMLKLKHTIKRGK